ncbi:BRCA2-interacting transcriptional repressor EMSY-like isoform X2 [Oppia nitens]|uniref:BRCA2-interacting transcriptional repressor EMSY-like isoform X2 n=1 Tax=Oppia nitens TaxID=1686743 RepID=UPI0023DBA8A3|nr:BRCA2-interacting transcriptional repressor EMSY-like isoform X2 [Oppia nitens]
MVDNMWPMILDNTRDECKRSLRRYELEAYSAVVTALRAQGDLNKDKRKLLQDLCSLLSISLERHRAEIRRAVNDEKLNTIAHHMSGANTSTEWTIEGRRLIPLLPRLVPQTAFTGVANSVANEHLSRNQNILHPSETGMKHDMNQVVDDNSTYETSPKRRRIDSQSQPTFVPIKSNQNEPIIVQSGPTTPSNHRTPHSISKVTTTRTVVSASNCYTITTPTSQSSARVIIVSTPTTTSSTVMTPSTRGLTAIPYISKQTISSSPQKTTTFDIPSSRGSKQARTSKSASVVGVIGVSGSQKSYKQLPNKTINAGNLSFGNITRIPVIPGTNVIKSNGQQQLVVVPINSRQLIPINQAVKSSGGQTVNTPTLIYHPNIKNANQKVIGQQPNLIIMQKGGLTQMAKTIPISSAITINKASITKPIMKTTTTAAATTIAGGQHRKQVIDIGPIPGTQTFTLSDNTKIITKRLQTSSKSLQEIAESLSENQKVIEIDASNSETLANILNKGGQITQADLIEFLKKHSANTSAAIGGGQLTSDRNRDDDGGNDSSSEDTVSTCESPNHDFESEFETLPETTGTGVRTTTNITTTPATAVVGIDGMVKTVAE